ncbi:MAG: TlpA family protein disulfide reductase [Alphaproteobacteria bacterium]|nr:TlpA family protein disulfide reductase [Alphaproteobacteria bacterium]
MIKTRKNLKRVAVFGLLASLYVMPSWAEQMKPFSLSSLQGGPSITSDIAKGKIAIVDFWASWCEPCKASFAAYNELLNKYGDKGLVIVGINIDNEKEKALGFLAENPAHFLVAADPDKKVAEAYNLPTMPTSYIIGRDGNILYTHAGYHEGDLAEMEQEVENALNQGKERSSQNKGTSEQE